MNEGDHMDGKFAEGIDGLTCNFDLAAFGGEILGYFRFRNVIWEAYNGDSEQPFTPESKGIKF